MKKIFVIVVVLICLLSLAYAYQNPKITLDYMQNQDGDYEAIICPAIITRDIEVKTGWGAQKELKSGDIVYYVKKCLIETDEIVFKHPFILENDDLYATFEMSSDCYRLLENEKYIFEQPTVREYFEVSNVNGANVYLFPNLDSEIIDNIPYNQRVDCHMGNYISVYNENLDKNREWTAVGKGFVNLKDLDNAIPNFTILESGDYGMLARSYNDGSFSIPENAKISIVVCKDDIVNQTNFDYYYNGVSLLNYDDLFDLNYSGKEPYIFYTHNIMFPCPYEEDYIKTNINECNSSERNLYLNHEIVNNNGQLKVYKYPNKNEDVLFTYESGEIIEYTHSSDIRSDGDIRDYYGYKPYNNGTWFYVSKDGQNGYVTFDKPVKMSGDKLYVELPLDKANDNYKEITNTDATISDDNKLQNNNLIENGNSGETINDTENSIVENNTNDNKTNLFEKMQYTSVGNILIIILGLVIIFIILLILIIIKRK